MIFNHWHRYGHYITATAFFLYSFQLFLPAVYATWLCCLAGVQCVILCFVDRASLYNLFQMKPTGCTLLSIFISTSVHVSGICVPIISRIYCICATLEFFTLEQVDSFKNYKVLCSLLSIVVWMTCQAFCHVAAHFRCMLYSCSLHFCFFACRHFSSWFILLSTTG